MIRFGYTIDNSLRSLSRLRSLSTVARAHPEALRRVLALIEACPLRDSQGHSALGVGTFWRSEAQQRAGGSMHAKVWQSWHQGRSPDDDRDAVAVDLVDWSSGRPQGDGPAMRWANDNCHRFGLRHFRSVNREPWHHQVTEVSTGRSYMQSTPRALPVIDLPGGVAPAPVDPGPSRSDVPRPSLRDDSTGPQADLLRGALRLFGWSDIKAMQKALGVAADGVYGPITAQTYSNFLDLLEQADDPKPPAAGDVTVTVQRGDGWIRVANRVGVDVDRLAAVNRTTIEQMLHPGDVLAVPGRSVKVARGDGWIKVAKVIDTDQHALRAANPTVDGLHPDMILIDPRAVR